MLPIQCAKINITKEQHLLIIERELEKHCLKFNHNA